MLIFVYWFICSCGYFWIETGTSRDIREYFRLQVRTGRKDRRWPHTHINTHHHHTQLGPESIHVFKQRLLTLLAGTYCMNVVCLHPFLCLTASSIQLILLFRANFETGCFSCEVWECKSVRLVRVFALACAVSCTGWVVCAATHTILMPKGRAIREQRGAKLREELRTDGADWRQRSRKRRGAVTYP